MNFKMMNIDDLMPATYNPRKDLTPDDDEYQRIKDSITTFGFIENVVYNKRTGHIVGGHQRVKVLKELGYTEVMTAEVDIDEDQEKVLNIGLNKIGGEWDYSKLQDLMLEFEQSNIDTYLTGFSQEEIQDLIDNAGEFETYEDFEEDQNREEAKQTLAERFIIPPFSIIDTRRGEWQRRKKAWINLGIKSHMGRGNEDDYTQEGLIMAVSSQSPQVYEHKNKVEKKLGRELKWGEYAEMHPEMIKLSGTSVFDPVLAEICYKWFAPKGGTILDPFAGGSVRGIVAGYCGYKYVGIDLRQEQVLANYAQAEHIETKETPAWICGDSLNIPEITEKMEPVDLIFSCPPYFDLEVYSEKENDLSNMNSYRDFIEVYSAIIQNAVNKLAENRFAIFVVTEIRGKKGFYENFLMDTIKAFENAGAFFYNDIILQNVISSLAVRVSRQFTAGRKIGRCHQNVLVFFKGDPKKITEELGRLDITEDELEEFLSQEDSE